MCALGRSLHFEAKAISEMKKRPFFDLGPTIMSSKRPFALLSKMTGSASFQVSNSKSPAQRFSRQIQSAEYREFFRRTQSPHYN
eukprot:UN21076